MTIESSIEQPESEMSSHIYVIVDRSRGLIYGVTRSLERAKAIQNEAELENPSSWVCISHEPILL